MANIYIAIKVMYKINVFLLGGGDIKSIIKMQRCFKCRINVSL
jgi:hypothetical protein